jgi:hypothetical protein
VDGTIGLPRIVGLTPGQEREQCAQCGAGDAQKRSMVGGGQGVAQQLVVRKLFRTREEPICEEGRILELRSDGRDR